MKRIFIALLMLMLVTFIVMLANMWHKGSIFDLEHIIHAAAVTALGVPFLFITAPFAIWFLSDVRSILYLFLGMLALAMMIYGFRKRQSIQGQASAVLGIIGWVALSIYGWGLAG